MAFEKKIELEVNDLSLAFNVNASAYNKYITGSMKPTSNGLQLATNFLTSVVDESCKDELIKFIKQPGAALHILSAVIEDYQPDFDISVKK